MAPVCKHCTKIFSTRCNLNKHLRKIHGSNPDPVSYAKNLYNYKCLEDSCDSSFRKNSGLIDHLQKQHKFEIAVEEIEFEAFDEFNTWKRQIEEKECCNYVKPRGRKVDSDGNEVMYFICNRSVNNKAPRQTKTKIGCKRRTKSQGSCKLDRNCISQMKIIKQDTGNIKVIRQKTHYGHTAQLQHLRICKEDRNIIASKLKSGASASRILDSNCNKTGTELKRTDLLTKQDIANIKRSYKLNVPGVKYDTCLSSLENVTTLGGNDMQKKDIINNKLSIIQGKLSTVDLNNLDEEHYSQILLNLTNIESLLEGIQQENDQFATKTESKPSIIKNVDRESMVDSIKKDTKSCNRRKVPNKEETIHINSYIKEETIHINSYIISVDPNNDHTYFRESEYNVTMSFQ